MYPCHLQPPSAHRWAQFRPFASSVLNRILQVFLELSPDDTKLRARDRPIAELVAVPFTSKKRVEVVLREAVDRSRHLALKRIASHLAVLHDFKANVFLQCHDLVDRTPPPLRPNWFGS